MSHPEDTQRRMHAVMYQPVKIGDHVVGKIVRVEPHTRDAQYIYDGRFNLHVELAQDPHAVRVLDGVFLPPVPERVSMLACEHNISNWQTCRICDR